MAVLLPLLLTLVSAMAQTTVYEGATSQLYVEELAGDSYEWEIYTDAPVDFAIVPGNCPVEQAAFTSGNKGKNVGIKWLKPGIYFYKVTARDAAFCAMNFKVGMFTVLSGEAKAVIKGLTLTGVCQQVLLDASASTGDNLRYQWSMADTGCELTQTKTVNTEFLLSSGYSGPLPASFKVKLTVTDIRGKTDEGIITITVDRRPVASTYSSGKYETDGTMLADGKLSKGTNLNYNWYSTGGKIIGSDSQQTAKLYGAGLYTLKVTDAYMCPNEYSFPINFKQVIAVRDYARLSWSRDTILQVLNNDHLPDDFVPGRLQITKSPLTGDIVTNSDGTITYTPRDKHPGHDLFEYKVCDVAGNCSSATVTIDIFDSPVIAPEGFSPNGDGLNDVLKFEGLDAYPNSKLYVYTRSGALVYKSDGNGYNNLWDGSMIVDNGSGKERIPTGTYYYVLQLGGSNRTLKQFIYVGY